MTSIRVKFRPSTSANKEGIVYYQLIQNRICKQITSSYKLHANEWKQESSTINIGDSAYHRRMYLQKVEHQIMRDLSNFYRVIGEGYTLEEISSFYARSVKESSLFEFATRLINEHQSAGRAKTVLSYKTTIRSFSEFLKKEDIDFSSIRQTIIKQYEQHLKDKQICNNTISFYMRVLRAIYNRAVSEGLTEQNFPFKGVYVGTDKTIKRAVDESVISRLKAFDLSGKKDLEFARDMFLFSFYCRGMAFVDVAHLTQSNVNEDYIVYQRHKTGQKLSVKLEPCLNKIIDHYSKRIISSQFLLPILAGDNSNYESALRLQNKRLKKISKLMGLNTSLTSYVARHSWATLAKRRGVSTQIISESMGHSNEKTTLIYLSSLDSSVIDQANAKLISEV